MQRTGWSGLMNTDFTTSHRQKDTSYNRDLRDWTWKDLSEGTSIVELLCRSVPRTRDPKSFNVSRNSTRSSFTFVPPPVGRKIHVPGSFTQKLMTVRHQGNNSPLRNPAFWITINPSDLRNPLVVTQQVLNILVICSHLRMLPYERL